MVGLSDAFSPTRGLPAHAHRKAQLLYTTSGVMRLSTESGDWILPSQRALWIPSGVEHSLRCRMSITVHALYLQPELIGLGRQGCQVLNVTPLFRELLLRAVTLPWVYDGNSREWQLYRVLLDELRLLDVAPLHLPLPSDPRARQLCDELRLAPADRATLAAWAPVVGASERTLARLFRAETGMSFGVWRQHLRLHWALEHLAEGRSVLGTALECGYESASSFIASFRQVFGVTPGVYFGDASGSAGTTAPGAAIQFPDGTG